MLNDIINQTAASESSDVVLKQPRHSLQSGGSTGTGAAVTSSAPAGQTSTAMALERARPESRKISMMLDDEEDEGPRLKEKITEACQQFVDIFCVWDCCWVYIKLSEVRSNQGFIEMQGPRELKKSVRARSPKYTPKVLIFGFYCILNVQFSKVSEGPRAPSLTRRGPCLDNY